jgi:FtsP/CotA-like multicopper oxidase with cupredoxin domain
MRSDPRRFGEAPAFGFMLAGVEGAAPEGVPVPGPVLVLTRGQPVEITLVNRLPEGTAIHWHGMELDSYYDGVHGWSGTATRVTPMIDPGETFVVRFTPPRTGTFMYHTHLHDRRQLTSGLYGAMLVVEPGEAFDARTDHVVVLGRGGPDLRSPVIINERSDPVFVWKAGARHRVRLINITPDDIVAISLQSSTGPLVWRPLTKDGAPLPAETGPRDARQVIGVGETYDFEVEAPTGRQNLWLEIRSPGGKWLAQAQVIVR